MASQESRGWNEIQNQHGQPEGKKDMIIPSTTAPRDNEWRAWKIRWWWMSILITVEILIIAAVVALERISATRNGIASVPHIPTSSVSHFSLSAIWRYGLLWTTLPSLLMVLYRIMWDTVVSGSSDRQPFVELARSKEKAANAKLTIMLDYRSYPPFYSWLMAYRNGHILLGCAMLLSLVISIAVVPLTAHLFITAPSAANSTIELSSNLAFNDRALTATVNWQPAFDLASAIRIYGSTPPAYMTSEYAFVPLETISQEEGNVTFHAEAYSAYLDCQQITNSTPGYSATLDGSSLTLHFNDRGCAVTGQQFVVLPITPKYAVTWYSTCSGSEYSRVGVFMGQYSASTSTHMDPFTVISCIPSYWQTTGLLTVLLQPSSAPQFSSFSVENSTTIRPFLYQTLEANLNTYNIFDSSSTFRSDAFGFYAYSYALKQNASAPFASSVLLPAVESMFTTFYASLANTLLFTPNSTAQSLSGTISTAATRLFVVTPVAYAIVGVLFLALVCNIFLLWYAVKHHSILTEEPVGMLGHALLAGDSGVQDFVENFRTRHGGEVKALKYVKKNYAVKEARCFRDEGGRVVVDGLVRKETSGA